MGVWNYYLSRLEAKGATMRGARLQRSSDYINRKLPSTLSYHTAIVNGVEQQLAILNSDNLNVKTVCSLPGEDIQSGSLVEWADNYWLVISEDANKEVYAKVSIQQCNHLLKWIDMDSGSPEIVERWCYVSDNTRHMIGETVSLRHDNGMSVGDSRISMVIARDKYTARFTRDNRFIIDDPDSIRPLGYRLTKPFKLGGIGEVFNGRGVLSFVLSEENTEDGDNLELHIADYYKHFPIDGMGFSALSNGAVAQGTTDDNTISREGAWL